MDIMKMQSLYNAGKVAALKMMKPGKEFMGAWNLADKAGHARNSQEHEFFSAGALLEMSKRDIYCTEAGKVSRVVLK